MTPQQQALAIIRNEHRTLAAVVSALEHVATDMAIGKLSPDYKLLWSIMYYIEEFPERLHHPKEDGVLFPRLRNHGIDDTLDDLARQHTNSRPHLDALKNTLGHMEADISGAVAEFAKKVSTYAGFQWQHMNQEETIVLRKAIEVFSPEDWAEVATSFAENKDPLQAGSNHDSEWFRQFYRRLVMLVPEPWGVGERR